jgi:hypothetical protein
MVIHRRTPPLWAIRFYDGHQREIERMFRIHDPTIAST